MRLASILWSVVIIVDLIGDKLSDGPQYRPDLAGTSSGNEFSSPILTNPRLALFGRNKLTITDVRLNVLILKLEMHNKKMFDLKNEYQGRLVQYPL